MLSLATLKVKIFADGADKAGLLEQAKKPHIKGFTTNPTLMRKAGVTNYEAFARDILTHITDRHISFEVFSDDFDEMYLQALKINGWGSNVYVKVPVTNTKGQSAIPLLKRLAPLGVKLNVTAIFTLKQVQETSDALAASAPACISVFAGRIADTGVDPMPAMKAAMAIMAPRPHQELIWASTRELFNIAQADSIGCHIITAPNDIISKLSNLGKGLEESSLDTVKTFRADSLAAGFSI